MSEQNCQVATKKFLSQLYKNTKMGADSIIDIMPNKDRNTFGNKTLCI